MVNGITKEPILNGMGAWKQNLADGLSSEVWKGYRVTVGSLLLVVGVISAIVMIIYALRNKLTTTTDIINTDTKKELNKSNTTTNIINTDTKKELNKSNTTTDIINTDTKKEPESPLDEIEQAIMDGDVTALAQKEFDIHACGKAKIPYIIFAVLNESTTKTNTGVKNSASQVVNLLALKDKKEKKETNQETYPDWQAQYFEDMKKVRESLAGILEDIKRENISKEDLKSNLLDLGILPHSDLKEFASECVLDMSNAEKKIAEAAKKLDWEFIRQAESKVDWKDPVLKTIVQDVIKERLAILDNRFYEDGEQDLVYNIVEALYRSHPTSIDIKQIDALFEATSEKKATYNKKSRAFYIWNNEFKPVLFGITPENPDLGIEQVIFDRAVEKKVSSICLEWYNTNKKLIQDYFSN